MDVFKENNEVFNNRNTQLTKGKLVADFKANRPHFKINSLMPKDCLRVIETFSLRLAHQKNLKSY